MPGIRVPLKNLQRPLRGRFFQAVPEHIRKSEYASFIEPTFRMLKPGSRASHVVDLEDQCGTKRSDDNGRPARTVSTALVLITGTVCWCLRAGLLRAQPLTSIC